MNVIQGISQEIELSQVHGCDLATAITTDSCDLSKLHICVDITRKLQEMKNNSQLPIHFPAFCHDTDDITSKINSYGELKFSPEGKKKY